MWYALLNIIKFFAISITGLLVLVVLLNLVVLYKSRPAIVATQAELNEAEAVIILGASVYESGALSPVLKERVDTALSIYQNGFVKKILVSGDNQSTEYNEVVPVREYLLASGVPPEDIFLDYAGFDTYDTMYRAKAIFEVSSAIVVTQSFHLPRAIYIARALNINAQGIHAGNDSYGTYNVVREWAARVKSVGEVVLGVEPRYLGEQIPIAGDGRDTVGETTE